MENDVLENRIKEATAEESRQLLEEFLCSFCVDQSEVEVEQVTLDGQVTE
jgi:hypothetical protein